VNDKLKTHKALSLSIFLDWLDDVFGQGFLTKTLFMYSR